MEKQDFTDLISLLLQQWKDKPNLVGIINGSLARANDIQDAVFEIRDLLKITTAEGVQLDLIGKVFNEFREGRSDTDYRAAILVKGTTNYSGEPEAIISILKSQYGASFVKYSPEYPGKYRVRTDTYISHSTLDTLSMAGVSGYRAGGIRHLSPQGYLLDQQGNTIVHIDNRERQDMIDADGNNLISAGGTQVITAGFY